MQSSPLHSLIDGSWFKLICGASYQHLPVVRNLALAYSLAGADCIDVAADPAVIAAAQAGITTAQRLSTRTQNHLPWLMVSINDGEDPHFRKAKFEVTQCPPECTQPCVQLCPAEAIDLNAGGVIEPLCYGCGRCLPVCPQELIETQSHQSSIGEVRHWIEAMGIDAVEIHTQVGHYDNFKQVWQDLLPIIDQLKLLAISCTDAPGVIEYLRSLYSLIGPLTCGLLWQTDGRSMSGDIGRGTTHAAIAFAQQVLQAQLPGYVQLAGGTNDYTVDKLRQLNLIKKPNLPLVGGNASPRLVGSPDKLVTDAPSNGNCSVPLRLTATRGLQACDPPSVSGVAYGSYARGLLLPFLNKLQTPELHPIQVNSAHQISSNQFNLKLEQDPEALAQAVATASQLVNQLKQA